MQSATASRPKRLSGTRVPAAETSAFHAKARKGRSVRRLVTVISARIDGLFTPRTEESDSSGAGTSEPAPGPTLGSHSSHVGRYQFQSLSSFIDAGAARRE